MQSARSLLARFVLLLLLSLVTGCADSQSLSDSTPKEEEGRIRESFDEYRNAVSNFDGSRAAETVSSDTMDVYQQWRDLALTADEQTVRRLPPLDMYYVLLLRQVLATRLLDMDGRAVFIWTTDKLGGKKLAQMTISNIQIQGNKAFASVGIDGQGHSQGKFVYEGDRWRYNVAAMMDVSRGILAKQARDSGKPTAAFIFQRIATNLPQHDVTDTLWIPIAVEGVIAKGDPSIDNGEMDAIRAVFDRFRKGAVDGGDTQMALMALSDDVFTYFEQLRSDALAASKDELMELPVNDLLLVLGFRHAVGAELARMDSREFVAYAIESGWMRGDQLARIELSPRRVSDGAVMCEGLINGQRTLMQFGFVRQSDGWKYDYTSMNPNAARLHGIQARQSGQSDSEYVISLLSGRAGEPLPESIWIPLQDTKE